MLYEVNQDALRYELEHLGVYKPSVDIMLGKGKITPLKVLHVRTPAANIIKQEMLAAGGDCATPGTTITCAVPHVDILLLGNANQMHETGRRALAALRFRKGDGHHQRDAGLLLCRFTQKKR